MLDSKSASETPQNNQDVSTPNSQQPHAISSLIHDKTSHHPSKKSNCHKKQNELERYFEFVNWSGSTTSTTNTDSSNTNVKDSLELYKINSNDTLLYFNKLCVAMQFSQLLSLKLFPNAKEISESFSAYYNIRDYLIFSNRQDLLSNNNVICYVVADGNVPRTGATFACSTNWHVFSIDPRMKKKWKCLYDEDKVEEPKEPMNGRIENTNNPSLQDHFKTVMHGLSSCEQIQRLYPLSQTTDEFLQSNLFNNLKHHISPSLNVIIAVHSHADLWQFYKEIPSPKVCLSIPCCFAPNIPTPPPLAIFKDEAIHSEKNVVYMWSE
ncbi:hypothetical protein C9374_007175 [Naegleria lovaniensis]|uniref:Uncharacterized protein n=1 Tax=Naegleria lovaniensis TaxID=51637 RepID=A0AA88GZU1_NAELO|nr:uncharacterized protein C9374_007175 [Naegleria lovaniensis]KAG2393644.1 hypothetical protein C9374_007175 [Naegleria lovaniensis]